MCILVQLLLLCTLLPPDLCFIPVSFGRGLDNRNISAFSLTLGNMQTNIIVSLVGVSLKLSTFTLVSLFPLEPP